jgi:hypothetical protein
MSVGNKFAFKIANTNVSDDKVVAILTGNLPTDGYDVVQSGTTPFAVTSVKSHSHDKTALVAYGINVDAVLDDGTIDTNLVATSKNLQYKINHFKNYLKFNPQMMTELTIEASNKDVFEQDLFLRKDSPLQGTGLKQISLSDYLNVMQNQENKIVIPLGNVPVDDETIMYMNIPAGRTVNFYMKLVPYNPWA